MTFSKNTNISKKKLPSLTSNEIVTKKRFDPLITKQKLFLLSRSHSMANMNFEKKLSLKICRPYQSKFPYQTRFDTDKYNNKALYKIKKNLNFFSNNRSCDNIKPKFIGTFDQYNVPKSNRSNSMLKLKDPCDSIMTSTHYEKILNSVKGKSNKVNKTEIKFDLKSFCEKEKEKTHRIIFNNTNKNYLAKFKLPKLSNITIQPKILLSKSPTNRKMMGERFNPFLHEQPRRNLQVRNYHGGLYPY